MVNPHQQSQYENTYINPGRYQHIGNGADSFDRGYNCGHGVNQFGYYGDNMVRIEFIIRLGTVETNAVPARSLVVSDLRSKTKGSRFESGCQLCAEVSSLQ